MGKIFNNIATYDTAKSLKVVNGYLDSAGHNNYSPVLVNILNQPTNQATFNVGDVVRFNAPHFMNKDDEWHALNLSRKIEKITIHEVASNNSLGTKVLEGGLSVVTQENITLVEGYNYFRLEVMFGSVEPMDSLISESFTINRYFYIKVPPKLDGVCGSSHDKGFIMMPSTNLCSTGSANNVIENGTSWGWSCSGLNGGNSISCSANNITNGVCGSSHNGSFTTEPTQNLCSAGAASSVSGIGPWAWSCTGNGGTTDSCAATTSYTDSEILPSLLFKEQY